MLEDRINQFRILEAAIVIVIIVKVNLLVMTERIPVLNHQYTIAGLKSIVNLESDFTASTVNSMTLDEQLMQYNSKISQVFIYSFSHLLAKVFDGQ